RGQAHGHLVPRADGLGRGPRALQRARVDGVREGAVQRAGDRLALPAPVGRERDVAPAREAPLTGGLRLAVPYSEEPDRFHNPDSLHGGAPKWPADRLGGPRWPPRPPAFGAPRRSRDAPLSRLSRWQHRRQPRVTWADTQRHRPSARHQMSV